MSKLEYDELFQISTNVPRLRHVYMETAPIWNLGTAAHVIVVTREITAAPVRHGDCQSFTNISHGLIIIKRSFETPGGA